MPIYMLNMAWGVEVVGVGYNCYAVEAVACLGVEEVVRRAAAAIAAPVGRGWSEAAGNRYASETVVTVEGRTVRVERGGHSCGPQRVERVTLL